MTFISVIIPCYNVEEYISECIDSVLQQTHRNLEIICVDNNSTDKTLSLLKNYQSKYPEKIIVLEEHKKGASAARNKGLQMAKGEWIQFLDADDLLLKEKLGRQCRLIDNNVCFIVGTSSIKKLSGETVYKKVERDVFKGVFTNRLGDTCANLWNADYLRKAGFWNEKLMSSQETDLMFRMLKLNTNVIFDSEPNTIIRERAQGQISQTNDRFEAYVRLRIEVIDYLKRERSTYFADNAHFFYQFLFDSIRTLAKFNLALAHQFFKQAIPSSFKPSASTATSSKYLLVFRALGFYLTEILIKMFARK